MALARAHNDPWRGDSRRRPSPAGHHRHRLPVSAHRAGHHPPSGSLHAPMSITRRGASWRRRATAGFAPGRGGLLDAAGGGRRGIRCAGRSSGPAAGARCPGWRRCPAGGCGRCLPGHAIPPGGVPSSRAMASAWACWSRAWRLAAVRDDSSPRLFSVSAWPSRSPTSRLSRRASRLLAAADG
jgi:hypothetical protein